MNLSSQKPEQCLSGLEHYYELLDRIAKKLLSSHRIWNFAHENPDGDTIGCALALHLALKGLGKDIRTFFPEKLPRIYSNLPGADQVEVVTCLPNEPPELIIATDNATFARFGETFVRELNKLGIYPSYDDRHNPARATVINIDHHSTNELYGDINLIAPYFSAVGEIILEIIKRLGCGVNKEIATCLLAAIVTDTGRFSYSNTNLRTLESSAELVRAGASLFSVADSVFSALSPEELKLLGEVLTKLVVVPELGFCYSFVEWELLEKYQVELTDSEWIMDVIKMLKEPKVYVLFKELSKGIVRVSVRSKNEFDCVMLAEKFGGGGHHAAAGYTFKGSLAEAISKATSAMQEIKRSLGKLSTNPKATGDYK